jgi:hypothetical protein
MKFLDHGTKYLIFDSSTIKIEEEVMGVADITFRIIKKNKDERFSIIWKFDFIRKNGEEIHSELQETQFNYFDLSPIELDFIDLTNFLARCVLHMQGSFRDKNTGLSFPEINLEVLTCQVLEKIIVHELS